MKVTIRSAAIASLAVASLSLSAGACAQADAQKKMGVTLAV